MQPVMRPKQHIQYK